MEIVSGFFNKLFKEIFKDLELKIQMHKWKSTLCLSVNINFYVKFFSGDHSKIALKTKNVFVECTATDLTKVHLTGEHRNLIICCSVSVIKKSRSKLDLVLSRQRSCWT